MAVRVTDVPELKDALQIPRQLIPAGELVTDPKLMRLVFRVYLGETIGENAAVTVLLESMVTMQEFMPEQAPDHPEKV